MNGSDFKIIRDMAIKNKLSFIDLNETNIISGGDYYLQGRKRLYELFNKALYKK